MPCDSEPVHSVWLYDLSDSYIRVVIFESALE